MRKSSELMEAGQPATWLMWYSLNNDWRQAPKPKICWSSRG